MSGRLVHRVLTLVVGLTALTAIGPGSGVQASVASPPPITLPALRQWTPGGVGYAFAPGSRIVVAAADAGALAAVAQRFAADLAVPVATGAGQPGDIVLRLGEVTGSASTERYRVTSAPTLEVVAPTPAGVFLGSRSVLQWLHQGSSVAGGTAVDWPAYPERGLMLDVGRKYMSVGFIRKQIREMSYLMLNFLHLHLSDRGGFRLESTSHPEVTSAQHYTKAEIQDLIAYAADHGVQVIPELDFPGHLDAVLDAHPELRLVSKTGVVNEGSIDLSNPAAYDLMRDLLEEFLPLFPGKYWHIGADEYLDKYDDYPQLEAWAKQHYGPDATGKDAYYGFMNWADAIVRSAGKTTRAFNDGLKPGGATLSVNTTIVIEHWARGTAPWFGNAYSAQALVDLGYTVLNISYTPTQYTLGGPGSLFNTLPSFMYDTWDPGKFVDGSRLRAADRDRNLGSKIQLWCDGTTTHTEADLERILFNRLQVMAQETWGTPSPLLYLLFLPTIKAVGHAPG
jgi:hexosaminidase